MLLDTSGLLSLLDAREPFHQRAAGEYARAASRVKHGYMDIAPTRSAGGNFPSTRRTL